MTVPVILGYDAIHSNISSLPNAQAAGYVTGSGGVEWSAADWAAHPGAVRIDQSPVNTSSDETADVLDFESGAATTADLVPWCKAALASYKNKVRPGQRSPAVYCSASQVSTVVNALTAAKVSGIGLWVAHYGVGLAVAESAVAGGSGPYPIIGFQYDDTGGGGAYDQDVFSIPWLNNVSQQPTIKQGSAGAVVVLAQQLLNSKGVKPGLTADGSFGPLTTASVKAFQNTSHLTSDGVVGPATWSALQAVAPPPVSWPAPQGLKVNGVALSIGWQPLVLGGQTASSYILDVVQLNGASAAHQTVPTTSTIVNGLVSGWTYNIKVKANEATAATTVLKVTA